MKRNWKYVGFVVDVTQDMATELNEYFSKHPELDCIETCLGISGTFNNRLYALVRVKVKEV